MSTFHLLLTALLAAILLGGWTYAWLLWSFKADVRAWLIAALFPTKWLDELPRRTVAGLSPTRLTYWLVTSSDAPAVLKHLLYCHYCWSAHVATTGTLLLCAAGVVHLPLLPFVWAGGAAIGNYLYARSTSNTTQPDEPDNQD